MSLLLKFIFMFKCNLSMLRLTTVLNLLALPLAISHLLCFYKRIRPPSSLLSPIPEAIVLGLFPIAWFFGFLYYTETPSLLFVVLSVASAFDDKHWQAALVRLVSTFRLTVINGSSSLASSVARSDKLILFGSFTHMDPANSPICNSGVLHRG